MTGRMIGNPHVSRPKDKSLEAYKAWILEIKVRLTTSKEGIKLNEEEWVRSWKEYWKEQSKSMH